SKVFTGNPSYYWTVEGEHPTGVSFYKTFTEAKSYTATLKVTDEAKRSCVAEKSFNLTEPACPASPTISLSGIASTGDFCNGMIEYRLGWKNGNLPSGAKQISYEVTVRNKQIPTKTKTKTMASSSTVFWIPTSWLGYDSEYEWQVKVTIASSDGKCVWDVSSPWSSGDMNIKTPHEYPKPVISVKNGGTDCLLGGCFEGENLKFDAAASKVFTGNPSYAWTVNGEPYSVVSFSKSLTDGNHSITLKVTDGDKHSCVIGKELILGSEIKHDIKWNEIAPS
ncbi:MAG: hypothetical protein PHR38_06910, partial [Bacteroidales bacterium]|nr:hypothetical protein [Bacteroidales bacterium]